MPGGGRFLTGHASHQMGLDADIWLRMGTMTDSEALNSDGKRFARGEPSNTTC